MLLRVPGFRERVTRWSAVAAGALATAVGAVVMVGWLLRVDAVVQLRPDTVPMQFNTALAIAVCGVGLLVIGSARQCRLGALLGAAVVVLGSAVLTEYVANVDLGINNFFVKNHIAASAGTTVRMAPNTALGLILCGLNLMILGRLIEVKRRFWIVGMVTVLTLAIGGVSVIGYAANIEPLFRWSDLTGMAPQTAAGLTILGLGMLVRWYQDLGDHAARLGHYELLLLFGGLITSLLLWLGLSDALGGESALPETTFVTGSVLTVLLSLAVHLGRRAAIRARDLAKAYDDLKLETEHRQRAEQALRLTEERAELIIDVSHQAFLSTDAAGLIIDWNRHAEATFGWSKEEAVGRLIDDLILPERIRPGMHAARAGFLETGEAPVNTLVEIPALHRDGYEFPLEVSVTPILLPNGYIFAAFLQDITERKKREDELARSNEELRQFAYVASHDLQEPLRMVSSYLQLLSKRYGDKLDDDAEEFIRYAVDGAHRMKLLINALLEYSRVGTRGNPLEPTDACSVLRGVLDNLRLAIEEGGVVVTADPLPMVMADAVQLAQLFQNIVGNAVKFRAEHEPQVHIGVERSGTEWVFTIADNGIGIDEQYADRIFDVFERLHTNDEYAGTGIGLAICKKIVQRHGGRIWVESSPGYGATFAFTLPYAHLPAKRNCPDIEARDAADSSDHAPAPVTVG